MVSREGSDAEGSSLDEKKDDKIEIMIKMMNKGYKNIVVKFII